MGQQEEVAAIVSDPWAFCSRLSIKDKANRYHSLADPWPEQIPWWKALLVGLDGKGPKKYVLGLKPRQVGYTTVAAAYEFWQTYTSAHPRQCMHIAHEPDTANRMRQMVDVFREELPEKLRFPYSRGNDNEKRSLFSHNGAGFLRRVAGAKGKGRGGTYNDLHCTEVAHWATATSAGSRSEAGGADEEMWSSANAGIHDEFGRIIVESTGNGPSGVFYELWKQAKEDPAWDYVFVSWADSPRYSMPLTDGLARALEQDLNDEERRLLRDHQLTLEQLQWRRSKMKTEKWNSMRFRREYPLSDLEPFLFAEKGWFDQDALSRQMRWVPELGNSKEAYRIFRPPEKGMAYFIGMDTCGGVGEDSAVIHVLDIHLRHCAVWASNRASPREQAMMVSRIGAQYHEPLTLIEANHFGAQVIEHAMNMGGCSFWKNDQDKDFSSTGSTAGHSKRDAMVHARSIIEDDWCTISDGLTILQLQSMVEPADGNIRAANGGHDDYAMAYVLALFAARHAYRAAPKDVLERDKLPGLKKVRDVMGGRGG